MNRCMGALCFLLRSRTHSTKQFPTVVRARIRASTVISPRARSTFLAGGWGVAVEPFSGKTPKYEEPVLPLACEALFGELNRDSKEEEEEEDNVEELMCSAASAEKLANPSQRVWRLMLSMPGGQTIDHVSAKSTVSLLLPMCLSISIQQQQRFPELGAKSRGPRSNFTKYHS